MKCDVEHKVRKMYVTFGDVVITTIKCVLNENVNPGWVFQIFSHKKSFRPQPKENPKMCFSSTKKRPSPCPFIKNQKKSLPPLFNSGKKVSALPYISREFLGLESLVRSCFSLILYEIVLMVFVRACDWISFLK